MVAITTNGRGILPGVVSTTVTRIAPPLDGFCATATVADMLNISNHLIHHPTIGVSAAESFVKNYGLSGT